jgi:hypothetical protein
MLPFLYRCVLRLHPPTFRARFADEMLSIFDHASGTQASLRLLLDGLLSLARQWILRSEFWHNLPSVPEEQPASDGVPSFVSLDPFRPRTAAVIHGLVLSTTVFCLTCFAIRYSWIHVLHVHIPEVQWERPRPMPSSTGAAASRIAEDTSRPVQLQRQAPINPVLDPRFEAPSRRPATTMAMRKAVAGFSPQTESGTPGAATPSERHGALALAPQTSGSTTSIVALPPQAYAGTYVSLPPDRLTITISADSGRLRMEIAGTRKGTLAAVSETKFVVKGVKNCWIEFAQNENSEGVIRQLTLFWNGRQITAQRR